MTIDLNVDFLRNFEQALDPLQPEKSSIPAKVLGYGEISTVLSIDDPQASGYAFKRMPMFLNDEETRAYEDLYATYIDLLENTIGVRTVPSKIYDAGEHLGKRVLYIVQTKLDSSLVAQNAIHKLSSKGVEALLISALTEAQKVFAFNSSQDGKRATAIDGQISNWALRSSADYNALERGECIGLDYLDTSTPLIHENGIEQLNSELFLRSAPSFLVWFIRWAFLADVISRYYDFRKVAIDMIANFYKEQKADIVPRLIESANRFFASVGVQHAPITEREVKAYYKEDAMIWRIYLGARKIDRTLHKLTGKPYPYVLPPSVKR